MPVKINASDSLKAVKDVKYNLDGTLKTVKGIWYNDGGTLRRVYPDFYTATVYDGSNFFDFMKSGVVTGTYGIRLNWPSSGSNTTYPLTGFGQSSQTANVTKTSGALSSGNFSLAANTSSWTWQGGFVSKDLINFSKFKSITIEGSTTFSQIYYLSSNRRGVGVDIWASNQMYNNAGYVMSHGNLPVANDTGGANGQSHTTTFSKTVDITSWSSVTSGRLIVTGNAVNDYNASMSYSFTITKIIFNV